MAESKIIVTENDGGLGGDNEGGIVVTNMKDDVEGDDCAGDQMDGTNDEVKDECGSMECEQEIPTPSSGTNEKQKQCEPDRAGYCALHDCVGKWISVSDRKWKNHGKGRGFGYVYGKKKKYICGKKRISTYNSDFITSKRLSESPESRSNSDVSGHTDTGAGVKVKVSDGLLSRGLPGMTEQRETK